MTEPGTLFGILVLKPALVLAAAAVLAGSLRRRSAALRHAVWTGAILATLVLPLLYRSLPPLRLPLLPGGFAKTESGPSVPRIATGRPVPGPAFSLEGPLREERPGLILADWLPRAILFAWMAGVLGFGIGRLRAERNVRRLVRRARPAANRALLASVESRLGRTEVRLSDELSAPAVTGLFRPVLLLPASAQSWPAADLAAVLAHELGHVARRDCLLNFLADLARVVYWCNPLVWAAAARMRSESERACDDLVLRAGVDAQAYARLLLEVARTSLRSASLPLAATAMARPRELESRLLAVLDDRIVRTVPAPWMMIGLALAGLSVAVPSAALTLAAGSPQVIGPEPDRAGDALASPGSERLPRLPGQAVSAAALATLRGPDSTLAAYLLPGLSRAPKGDGDLVRERAAWALSRVRNGRLIEPLLQSLSAPDWREQAYAAWALADLRDPRSVPVLLPLLAHPVWRLRAMAAHALNRSVDPRAEPAMAAALTDPAWQVRFEAVGYFAQLGEPRRTERLTPRLRDRHLAVRLAAETALTSH